MAALKQSPLCWILVILTRAELEHRLLSDHKYRFIYSKHCQTIKKTKLASRKKKEITQSLWAISVSYILKFILAKLNNYIRLEFHLKRREEQMRTKFQVA